MFSKHEPLKKIKSYASEERCIASEATFNRARATTYAI